MWTLIQRETTSRPRGYSLDWCGCCRDLKVSSVAQSIRRFRLGPVVVWEKAGGQGTTLCCRACGATSQRRAEDPPDHHHTTDPETLMALARPGHWIRVKERSRRYAAPRLRIWSPVDHRIEAMTAAFRRFLVTFDHQQKRSTSILKSVGEWTIGLMGVVVWLTLAVLGVPDPWLISVACLSFLTLLSLIARRSVRYFREEVTAHSDLSALLEEARALSVTRDELFAAAEIAGNQLGNARWKRWAERLDQRLAPSMLRASS